MLRQFLLYNKVNQLYVYIYPHIPSLLHLPLILLIPPLQVVTKHRADLPVLCGYFPLAIYFTFDSVYMSMPLSHLIPAYPSPSPFPQLHFLCLHLYSCPVPRFFRTIFFFLAQFLIGFFVFLLLSFKSSLYILDNSPLSDMYFAIVFSQSVAYLLLLLTLSFSVQKFLLLMKSILSIIYFMDPALVLYLKVITIPKIIQAFSYVLFQEFYSFAFYIQVCDSF